MEYFQMIMSLVGVLALVFIVFWLMKKLNKRFNMNSTANMKVLERINLGPDKMLLLVSVCRKCMVICVTANGCEKICDLDETEDDIMLSPENRKRRASFEELFKKKLEQD